MIGVVGIKHDVSLEVRERLAVIPSRKEKAIIELSRNFQEVLVLSTCNRTEIYFKADSRNINPREIVFKCLNWNMDLISYTFFLKDNDAVKHLMDVVCGLDSLILGEDQILGQIKDAYETSIEYKSINSELQRLFQIAITCGKEFRSRARLGEIPVSSSSMVVKEGTKRGLKNYMILGYGKVGTLLTKYLLEEEIESIYIAARNLNSVAVDDSRVKVIPFTDKKKFYKDVECIVSCTSAPHIVVNSEDLPDKKLLIFDLAVPRDVHESVYRMNNTEVYNIDSITALQDNNQEERLKRIEENRYIIDDYIRDFTNWMKTREISSLIEGIKSFGEKVSSDRHKTFINKKDTKNHDALAGMLIKSTANFYTNRIIEILKDEHLNGNGEECRRLIERIFQFES